MTWDVTNPQGGTKVKDAPTYFLANWIAMDEWANDQHQGLTCASSGYHMPGECEVIKVGTTAVIANLTNVACAIAYDTTLNVFKYNSGVAWVNIGGAIPCGTNMIFYQDAAPTGWTIKDVLDDKLVYVTSGDEVGGTACTSGTWIVSCMSGADNHQLTIPEIASHRHSYSYVYNQGQTDVGRYTTYYDVASYDTGTTGGDESHAHTAVAHDAQWRPASTTCIICEKD